MTSAIAPLDPTPEVKALLAAQQLPTDDLDAAGHVLLFGCIEGTRLRGVVGLERHGHDGLLRSLAVDPRWRGSGLGAALLAHVERYAAAQGIDTLYLLTTTAAGYFERHGYRPVPRATAPAAIAATSQFSGLCPGSAAFMARTID